MKTTILKVSLILTVTMGLTACATKEYRKAVAGIQDTQDKIEQARVKQDTQASAVKMKSGYYVSDKPVSLEKTQPWLLKPISLQARNMPLNILMNRILRNAKVDVAYNKTSNPNRLVSINYKGTIRGALNDISTQLDYHYGVNNRQIDWSAFETKTFNISFMPGTSSYMLGQSQNGQQNGGGEGYHTGVQMNDQQYSSLAGQLSVWHDLENTLNQLKSKQGRVMISQSTTSVTVHDRPSNIRAMSKYIEQLNTSLSQEVAIKVQVLDIALDQQYSSGINWNVIFHAFNTRFKIGGALADAANLGTANALARSMTSAAGSLLIGDNKSNALIQALSKQGKLRVVSKPEVVTMNNQIASIRITQNTGYLRSIQSSFTNEYVSTSLTPGTVTDGLTLYILPKIRNDKVFMQISTRIANLIRIEKESNQPDSSSNEDDRKLPKNSRKNYRSQNVQYEAIELPTVAEKEFNIRSVIRSGSTLIIAGFKRLRDQTSSAKMFEIPPLGSKGSESKNIETLVLITPVVLHDN